MKTKKLSLNYPVSSGFNKSQIIINSGLPNFNILFPLQDNSFVPRVFVTDKTISSLECVKNFCSTFKLEKSYTETNIDIYLRDGSILIITGAGEKFKTIQTVLGIVSAALEFNFDRSCIFTAIGGGVICDMTGFAASIFKRGVNTEFIPTTLLAMVDASIGGKTGCDFEGYKNMIGSFYPAQKISYYSGFIQSLPEKEYRSGLAEAAKTALLFSKKLYSVFITESKKILSRDEDILSLIILECVKAKCSVVQKDIKEKAQRALLNFGHTFGHALEATSGLGEVTHGEAVAWGMGRALDFALLNNLCDRSYNVEAKKMLSLYGWNMNTIPGDENKLIQAMQKDKKNKKGSGITIITQLGLNKNKIINVTEAQIRQVLK